MNNTTRNHVKIIIANSLSSEKVILGAEPELCELRVGDEIEINFKEEGMKGDYEIVFKEEKWEMNDDGSDINWYIYTVKYIRGSRKKI